MPPTIHSASSMSEDSQQSRPPSQRGAARSEDILGKKNGPGSTGTPPAAGPWKWHQRNLLALHAQLTQERHSLRQAVREPLESHSLSEADSASDEFDHDLALTQLSHESDAIREIDDALRRIAEGRYGICEVSGRPIAPERLKAVPWTRYTCEVERKLEAEGSARGVRVAPSGTVREGSGVIFEEAGEQAETEATDETLGEPRPLPPGSVRSS